MADDDYGTDADFLAALEASELSTARKPIVQPTPQRLDKPAPSNGTSGPKVVQPTPQALPSRSAASSILVSPRQKGNPILTHLRSLPWEYSDIPSDYVLGLTTCALFLSLKYHRLHPEYIYNRIRALQGKYNLRILLTMVDIQNHEDSLKELSKTSLINNVTVVLCWSAAEAARYLELYKSYEHANPSAIREQRGTSYAERMVDFITVPRSINKTDAVSLVSAFGSIRAAVNARPEEIAVVSGWGEKKVKRWCDVVQEPFRIRKAARRRLGRKETTIGVDEEEEEASRLETAVPLSRVPLREMSSMGDVSESGTRSANDHSRTPALREDSSMGEGLFVSDSRPSAAKAAAVDPASTATSQPSPPSKPKQFKLWEPDDDDDEDDAEAMVAAALEEEERLAKEARLERSRKDAELSDGVAAALAKLRR